MSSCSPGIKDPFYEFCIIMAYSPLQKKKKKHSVFSWTEQDKQNAWIQKTHNRVKLGRQYTHKHDNLKIDVLSTKKDIK